MVHGVYAVLGKITYKMISNQKSKSHPRKWFKIKIKNHPSESDLKSKSKSLEQKDQSQNQNHKDLMWLLQDNIYVQKFGTIVPLYNAQKCIRALSIQ